MKNKYDSYKNIWISNKLFDGRYLLGFEYFFLRFVGE